MTPRPSILIAAAGLALGGTAFATEALAAKGTKVWNLTDNTITKLQLAPAGTQDFGPDQAKNDKDGAVDHDERLKITGVATGTYDAKLTDSKGRTCTARNLAVKQGEIFSIEEKHLECAR